MQVRLIAFWRAFRRSVPGLIGLGIIVGLVCVALAAGLLAPIAPSTLGRDALQPPGPAHWMGTDDLGRDIFSGVVHGTQISLMVGFLTAAVSTLIGIGVGGVSGYYGGVLDDVLMRVTEFFMVVPRFFLALVIVALFGARLWDIIVVLTVLSWPTAARLFRAEILRLKDQEFVQAAHAMGSSDRRILVGHLLPNSLASVIVTVSVQVAYAIILEAGLSFLGLGDPATRSWGVMLSSAQQFLRRAWWMATFPGLAIFLAVLGFNLIGDGVNDALNPRLRTRVRAPRSPQWDQG